MTHGPQAPATPQDPIDTAKLPRQDAVQPSVPTDPIGPTSPISSDLANAALTPEAASIRPVVGARGADLPGGAATDEFASNAAADADEVDDNEDDEEDEEDEDDEEDDGEEQTPDALEAMMAKAMSVRASNAPSTAVAGQRCGLIAIVGKPNVGKSTLLNALVGQKVSITSRKAQTTRHRITGMRTLAQSQFVFVDTPGFQTRHGNALNRSLNRTVVGAVNDVDLIVFVVEAGQFNLADAKVLALLPSNTPAILLANKFDLIHRRAEIAPWLRAMQERHNFAEFVPMSANNTRDVDRLFGICEKYLPEQPWMYGADELTDRSERFMAAEIIREKLFRLTGDELPYTSTVIIDKFEEEGALRRIAATIVVERDGHKGMIIGEKGEKLKRIGTEARHELETLTGGKVFLEIWVKVRSGWADDDARVKTFGYE